MPLLRAAPRQGHTRCHRGQVERAGRGVLRGIGCSSATMARAIRVRRFGPRRVRRFGPRAPYTGHDESRRRSRSTAETSRSGSSSRALIDPDTCGSTVDLSKASTRNGEMCDSGSHEALSSGNPAHSTRYSAPPKAALRRSSRRSTVNVRLEGTAMRPFPGRRRRPPRPPRWEAVRAALTTLCPGGRRFAGACLARASRPGACLPDS